MVQGARKEEQSAGVRVAALNALQNSLEFIRRNFGNPKERDFIMQVVCEATSAPNAEIVVVAFECLVRIMQLYYDSMKLYMEQALFGLTVHGMRSEDDRICLQAIEFWSTVCDEEILLAEEADDALELGEQPRRHSYNFAKSALTNIIPTLLFLLTK